jgi:hypothetical protein
MAYRQFFNRFSEPGEKFDEEWIDNFDDVIIEEGEWWRRILGKAIIPERVLA